MAKYNYWEAAGKPTSYEPMPAGYQLMTLGAGDFVIKFKAKSPNANRLLVKLYDDSFNKIVNPPTEYTDYEFSFTNKVDQQTFRFLDFDSAGVSVKDIQLVEKPLGRATINGIDGFRSGKWSLHPNAKIIDNEIIELNALGNDQYSSLRVECLPNATYYLNGDNSGENIQTPGGTPFGIGVHLYRSDNSVINGGWYSGPFTTTGDTAYFVVRISNRNNGTGKYRFKRPMLNLGPVPVPYEPKRGERMVPPQPGKNLINPMTFESGSIMSDGLPTPIGNRARVYPLVRTNKGSTYTITAPTGWRIYLRKFNDGQTVQASYTDWTTQNTFVATDSVGIIIAKADDSPITVSDIPPGFQLEEGTATPFEPYRVRTTRKRTGPARKATKTPKKNLVPTIPDGWESGTLVGGAKTVNASRMRTKEFIDVVPNATYYYSFDATLYDGVIVFYNSAGAYLGESLWGSQPSLAMGANGAKVKLALRHKDNTSEILPSEIPIAKPQFEINGVTPFEPYTLILRPATKYPKKNMFKGFTKSEFLGSGFAMTQVIDEHDAILNPNALFRNFYTLIDVEPNTFYRLSFIAESATVNNGQMAIFNEDASIAVASYTSVGLKFNSGNRTKIRMYFRNGAEIEPVRFKNVQLELGEVETPYQPYKGVLRQARR
jgi:hypothetical protein